MGKGRRNKVLKLTPAKVKYIIRAKSENISSRIISLEMKVSIRTVNRVWGHWVKNKEPLAPGKFGRSKTYLKEADKRLILEIHKEQNSGARRLEKIIEHKYGKHIPHNAIHQVLIENGLATENKKKKMRRKPYIRYERKHSLSAVHLDWHISKINGKEVCVVLDDSSRFILAGGEFDAAIGETSIDLVRKVLEDYGEVRKSAFDVFLAKMISNISWPELSILRPTEKLRNGIIPTRKVENYLMILTNSWIGTIRFAITRVSMRNTIYRLQKMSFGQECLMSAS